MKSPTIRKPFLSLTVLFIFHSLPNLLVAQSFMGRVMETIKNNPPNGMMHYKFDSDSLGDFRYPVMMGTARHHYLFHKGDIVVQLDGTGKLLKPDSIGGLRRMDSTLYEGYNFGAFNFVYKDTIFSLGGYGFWQFNGQLRYFSEANNSWSAIKTNTLVPVRQWYNAQVYFDVAEEKIYTVYGIPHEEWVMEAVAFDEQLYVQCLDLKTKFWWDKPKIADREVIKGSGWAAMAMFNAPQGLIAFVLKEVKLFDFRNNRLGHINISKARVLSDNWYQSEHLIMHSSGNKLFFINPAKRRIDSVQFSEADIQWTDTPLYADAKDFPISESKAIVLSMVLMAGISGFIFWKRRRDLQRRGLPTVEVLEHHPQIVEAPTEQLVPENRDMISARPVPFTDTLTTVEKGLLELILKNSAAGKMTSVLQVNEVLGIAKKDVKSQNNIRASTLQMINHKFTAYSGLHDELIMKQRTAFDKRFFEYYIHAKYIHKVK